MVVIKLSKKGQITIPSEYRKLLGTDLVEISYESGKIVIKPVKKLGGALKKYALKGKTIEEIMSTEKEAIVNGFTEREKKGNY